MLRGISKPFGLISRQTPLGELIIPFITPEPLSRVPVKGSGLIGTRVFVQNRGTQR